jgi:hypothetical protein
MVFKEHIFKYSFFVILIGLLAIIACRSYDNRLDTTYIYRNYDETIFGKVDYPKRPFDFCGESMPVNQVENYKKFNKQMRQYLAYPNGLKQLFRRADYYFPKIEKKLEKCGLPDDLKYIVMIESQFLKNTSPKGASGFWQFMPETAKNYGLVVTDSLDERSDVKKSTHAACNYISDLHSELKSWTLVAAAYNTGLGRVDQKMHKTNNLYPSYYTMKWNKETSVYVFKLLAVKYLYENRGQYGI